MQIMKLFFGFLTLISTTIYCVEIFRILYFNKLISNEEFSFADIFSSAIYGFVWILSLNIGIASFYHLKDSYNARDIIYVSGTLITLVFGFWGIISLFFQQFHFGFFICVTIFSALSTINLTALTHKKYNYSIL